VCVKTTIRALHEEFNEHFIERDDEILGAFLAILANENVLYLGPPGTAKTDLARAVCRSIEGGHFFYYLLTRFTTPEEIFGPLSLKSLENDEFRRKTEGSLPDSHIALLDEIFKANSSILNSLLTVLNERQFHNGTEIIDTPLLTVFGASNELPEEDENLEALYDRFLFRYDVRYIQNEENVKKLLSGSLREFTPRGRLTVTRIHDIQARSLSVTVPDDIMAVVLAIKKELEQGGPEEKKTRVSDRRWKKIMGVLKVAAAANGDTAVSRPLLLLLRHMLWDVPEEEERLRALIIRNLTTGGVNMRTLESGIGNLRAMADGGDEIIVDEKLPVAVYAHDALGGQIIATSRDLVAAPAREGISYFTIETSTATPYPYHEVMEILREKYWFFPKKIPASDKKTICEQEYRYLRAEYDILEKNLTAGAGQWKNTPRENIWLTQTDCDELVEVRREIAAGLLVLEAKMNALRERIQTCSSS